WKIKLYAAIERPAGDIEVHRELVIEFDPFHGRFVGLGMIHDFVEHQGSICADGKEAPCEQQEQQREQLLHFVRLPAGKMTQFLGNSKLQNSNFRENPKSKRKASRISPGWR